MPLTRTQIQEFTERARQAGLTDDQIAQEIEKKAKEFGGTSNAISQSYSGSTPSRPQPTQNRQSSTDFTSQIPVEEDQGGFVGNLIKGIVQPAVDYGNLVAEGVAQAGRFALSPTFRKAVLGEELTDEEIRELSQEQDTFHVDNEKLEDTGEILKTGVKTGAGVGSYFVPGGAGVGGAVRAGAGAGALYGFSQSEEFVDVDDIIYGAVGGAAGGAAAAGVGKAAGGVLSRAKNFITEKAFGLGDEAASIGINKATPSQWSKALDEHGFDLNKLTSKYWKKGAGYDEMLGEVGERNRGGVFKNHLDEAETAIKEVMDSSSTNTRIEMEDFVKELNKEKRILAKIPGNENNIKALDEFIKGFQTKYGSGMTPKQLLTIKRATDSRFGAAVANETTGTPTAQAQKMLANASRSKLKQLFPTVKDALDSQSEVLTLRPIISRARAITKTRGSTIRSGQLDDVALTDLVQPTKWSKIGEVILDDPKRASQFLQQATEEVVEETRPEQSLTRAIASRAPGVGTRIAGASAGTSLSQEPEDELQADIESGVADDVQDDQFSQQGVTPSDNILAQSGGQVGAEDIPAAAMQASPSPTNPFGSLSKRQVLSLALSQGAKASDLKEIEEIYDMLATDTGTITAETMQVADGLRTEYFKRTKENNWAEVASSYEKVVNTSETPAGDVSLIFGFMKMIDPGSVVREGEFATAENTAGIPERIRQRYNKALEGDRLSSEQRQAFKGEAGRIFQTYQQRQANIDAYYQGLAQRYGIDPSLLGVGLYNNQQ